MTICVSCTQDKNDTINTVKGVLCFDCRYRLVHEQTPITKTIGEQPTELSESVKLIKNTKGYNWEIRLLGAVDEALLNRLESLNNSCSIKFGQEV